jgi:hypothetical protein
MTGVSARTVCKDYVRLRSHTEPSNGSASFRRKWRHIHPAGLAAQDTTKKVLQILPPKVARDLETWVSGHGTEVGVL